MAHSLNPEQSLAVRTINGPVLILAGAGTGKTGVLTHRIARMLSKGIEPGNILAVTFTNKAAREMQSRVSKLIPRKTREADESGKKKPHRPTICTFHSLGVRILRRHIDALGYKKNFVIYSQSDQLGIIRKILSHISTGDEKTDPAAILSLLSRFRNGGEQAALMFSDDKNRAMAEHIEERYVNALKACNAVDFDDLILLTLKLLREHPDVLEACRNRYRYVMVDEYQDTNAKQFELVQLLTKEHRNLCVVGDDDQSIYGWRGAEIANLLDLEKYYPEVKTIKLEQNYRSTNAILKAANAVIKNNSRRKLKTLWSENGYGNRIQLASYSDDEEEAQSVVEEIEFRRMAKKIPWSDHAILFRTNQQARSLETALRNAKVRYRLVGGQSFFDRREIKEFLAYLKVILNPADDISLLRIANIPARGISDKTAQTLLALSQEHQCPVIEIMMKSENRSDLSRQAKRGIAELSSLISHFHQELKRPGLNLSTWAQTLLDQTRYLDELRRLEKNQDVADARVQNVQDLVDSMDQEQSSRLPDQRLQQFLEDLTLDAERADDKEEKGDLVTLITTHSCKGLEFPHVFLVGVEEGLLPHSRSRVEGTLEEERRLFYVAITRAMKSLVLSLCSARKRYGERVPCHPSPFLAEIPEDLVEHLDEAAKQPVAQDMGKSLFGSIKDAIQ